MANLFVAVAVVVVVVFFFQSFEGHFDANG